MTVHTPTSMPVVAARFAAAPSWGGSRISGLDHATADATGTGRVDAATRADYAIAAALTP